MTYGELDEATPPTSPTSSSGHGGGNVRLPMIATIPSSAACALAIAPAKANGIGGATRSRLAITVTAQFEGAAVVVELAEGELDRGSAGFPPELPKGVAVTAEFRSSTAIAGALHINGSPPVPFGVQVNSSSRRNASGAIVAMEKINFVSSEHRQRSVVAHAEGLEMDSGFSAKGDGVVAEVLIGPGHHADMTVNIRKAKKKELARLAQKEALVHAMETKKYSSLLAQITRSKMRKVETALIEQAGRLLKSIRPAEGTFLTHAELGKLMRWRRVTCPNGAEPFITEACSASASCSCNAGHAQEGETCSIINGSVNQALEDVAPANALADKWLFQALVKAAIAAPEGCVWKSGGKFLLSNEERNQSANAIVGVLERENQETDAGKGIRALISYTEREYGFRVTAVQLNFHPNQQSSHKQHRDIYGAGQKGGINCTCSFMKCTGTVCYSLGSSRQILCETITDKRSKYEACGEDCQGCKTYRWMHSGSAMYFNDPWNNNHTHGVPPMDEKCGPRISVALLCA